MLAEHQKKPCVFARCAGTMTFSSQSKPPGHAVFSSAEVLVESRPLQPGWDCSWSLRQGDHRHWIPEPDPDAQTLGWKRLYSDLRAAEVLQMPDGVFEVSVLDEGWHTVNEIIGGAPEDAWRKIDAHMQVLHEPAEWFPITHPVQA